MYGCGDSFQYFQCAKCGCLQIASIPSDLSKYYANNYYSYNKKPSSNRLKRFLQKLRDGYCVFGHGFVGWMLSRLYATDSFRFLAHLPIDRDSRILDVGCGCGRLLFSLQELGFRNLLGVDPFLPHDIEYPNGLVIRKQGLNEVGGIWDLIMFHHSFEHIPDGHAALRHVHTLLDSGGICIIRVPTVSSYAWEHYGVNWVQLDAPRHLWLHSIQSMEMMAKETNFALSVVVYDSGAMQFWGSEQYVKGIPLCDERSYAVDRKKSEFSRRQIRQFERRAAELNTIRRGDQVAFYLRKVQSPRC